MAGTLTSEGARLGESDVRLRWMGFFAHQAVVALLAAGVTAIGLFQGRSPWWWAPLSVGTASLALPVGGGDTLGQLSGTFLHFLARSRWHELEVLDVERSTLIVSKGSTNVRCYQFQHRGRLDLAEGDREFAQALRDLTDALAQRSSASRVSLHLAHLGDAPVTVLALEPEVSAPRGWSDGVDVASMVASAPMVFERWSYLRHDTKLVRCYRVFDFSAIRSTRSLLEGLQREARTANVSLMVEVLSSSRARRLTARAAHQLESDVAAASAVGFRRSARTRARQSRLDRRETAVAQGRALLRVAVYVTIEAANLGELRLKHASLWRGAHETGLRLERGFGRQFRWWSAQLPGGPSW
ncbi:MAG TPA: hypothetical protein VMU98_00300 [Acidimicrobiales bacterium]|nr:hypothetical protein [Acidimicrobiales bacterium]